MAKTGERSTTTRHDHLEPPPETVSSPAPADLPPRVAEPGSSDAAVKRGTGKTWDEWFAILDAWGATERAHPEIARYVAAEHGLSGWWAQHVTVGYERARGLRAVHQLPDGFSVNASKTMPVPVDHMFAAFVEDVLRDEWLEPETLRLRTAQPNRSARFDVLANGTRLEVNFTAKGEAKASAQVQHVNLAAQEDIEPWRAFWKERLDRLASLLTAAER
jgi:hypothetical protein